MKQQLFNEILMARQRVYEIGRPTPLDVVELPVDATVHLKREDLSPIHAFKWRGAYNRIKMLTREDGARGIVTASAGNHAQGVAMAANRLGLKARIYMPKPTPRMKQVAVARHGGDAVEIILHGDNYHAAAERAREDVEETGAVFVHPYNDLSVMGGQGTLADEIVMAGTQAFDVAYIQIGGGGLAAGVACWLKAYYPGIRIVGVEGVEQASMKAAIDAGRPVELEYVDVFCDGTAVKKVGDLTYQLCRELIDEFIQVSNEEVCAAIQLLWESQRITPEPSGAMGLAGLMKERDRIAGQQALCIVAGANMDFGRLAWIGQHAGIGQGDRHYLRIEIGERAGAMLELLEAAFNGLNIIDFQYGKVDPYKAWPVIGFEANPMQFAAMEKALDELGVAYQDVTSEEDVEFRLIHYDPVLFMDPFFLKLEFPERAGALHDFLESVRGLTNMCYFNYTYTGEQVGRALLGFEFEDEERRRAFLKAMDESPYRWHPVSEEVLKRVL